MTSVHHKGEAWVTHNKRGTNLRRLAHWIPVALLENNPCWKTFQLQFLSGVHSKARDFFLEIPEWNLRHMDFLTHQLQWITYVYHLKIAEKELFCARILIISS